MASVGTIEAVLELRDRMSAKLKAAERSLMKTSASMEKVGASATRAGASLTAGITLPLAAMATAAARASIKYESAFAGVIKTVDDASDAFGNLTQTGQELRQQFIDMSKEMPITAEELAGIGEAAGQLGVKTKDIAGFTDTMAKLGVATNLSANEAATSLARLANITGLEGVDAFQRLGSTVVELGNNLATTEREIVEMGLRIAGAGHQIGLTEAEILSLSGALSSVGIRAEAGGTAISRVMVEIDKAVSLGGESLKQFSRIAELGGLAGEQFADTWQNEPADALLALISGFGEAESAGIDLNLMLEDMGLDAVRVADVLKRVSSNAEGTTRAFELGNRAWKDNVALQEEVEKRFRTNASQLKILFNVIMDVARSVGDVLVPRFVEIARVVTSSVEPALRRVLEIFDAIPRPIQNTVLAIAAVAAAIGPLLVAFGLVVSALAAAAPAFGVVAAAGTALLGPVGLVAAAVAAAAGAWVVFSSRTTEAKEATDDARGSIDDMRTSLLATRDPVATLSSWFDVLKTKIRSAGQAVVDWSDAWDRARGFDDSTTRNIKRSAQAFDGLTIGLQPLPKNIDNVSDAIVRVKADTHTATVATDDWRQSIRELRAEMGTLAGIDFGFKTITEQIQGALQSLMLFNPATVSVAQGLGGVEATAARSGAAIQNFGVWTETTRPGVEDLTLAGRDLERALESIGTRLGQEPPVTFFENLREQLAHAIDSVFQGLPGVIVGAFQGGGDVGKSVGSFIGGSIGSSIGASVTTAIGGKLGSLVGGALGPLGAIGGQLLGSLFDSLINVGGPSKAELAGRELSNDFIDGFIAQAEVSSDRIAAAVADGWDARLAEFALAVQDTFEKAGRTAEEGMQAVQRLFDAIKEGPEATQAAIDAITDIVGEIEAAEIAAAALSQAYTDMADAVAERDAILQGALMDGVAAMQLLQESGMAAGIEVPEAFRVMLEAAELLEGEVSGPLVKGAEAAGNALKSLDTIGEISNKNFSQFGATIKTTFNKLIEGGATSEAALEAMRPTIAQLIFLQDKYGFTVDAGTQAIIDQGREYGITGEEGKSAADKQIEALDKVIQALNKIIAKLEATANAAGGVTDEMDNIPNSVNVDIGFNVGSVPQFNLPSHVTIPVGFGIPAMAEGGIVRKPTVALIGEAGPEAVQPLPPSGRLDGNGSDTTTPSMLRDLIAEQNSALVDALFRAIRDGALLGEA